MSLFGVLFGCSHRQTSRVWKDARGHYLTCFDCGQEISYNWKTMREGEPRSFTGKSGEPGARLVRSSLLTLER